MPLSTKASPAFFVVLFSLSFLSSKTGGKETFRTGNYIPVGAFE